jgi:hypothetical protein
MVCGDISSVGGQSSSTDESDSAMSLTTNVRYIIEILKKKTNYKDIIFK